jgi:NTE family protein
VTTAWLLRGGASLGAAQVGMARALLDAGYQPDILFGASAGALNAAWLAVDPTPQGLDGLSKRWVEVRRSHVFPFRPLRLVGGLAGWRDHTLSNAPLARWLRGVIPLHRLEDSALPLVVVAADLETGEVVLLDKGPAVPALLASCAMPGIFPPVRVGGRWLVDGSVGTDTPIEAAVRAGAKRVFVIEGVPAVPMGRPVTALDVLLRSVSITLARYSSTNVARWAGSCELYVVPAPLVPGTSPFRFNQSKVLIEAGYRHTVAWLRSARPEAPTAEASFPSSAMGTHAPVLGEAVP